MPEYRLHYFNSRGRAEIIRLIFKVAGVDFEDIRYNPETEWAAVKDKMPFGQVPVLEIDGKKIAQSPAIARYLAEEFKLLGNDKMEALQADMIAGSISDLIPHARPAMMEKDEAKKKELAKKLFVDIIVPYLVRLEKIYKENGKAYLVSDKLTWSDLAFFAFFNLGVEHKSTDVIFGKTPALKALYEKIANIPAIKTWVETRPASAT